MIDLRKPQQLIIRKQGELDQGELAAAAVVRYTVPAKRQTIIPIGGIKVVNRANQARELTIWKDDDGTGQVDANLIRPTKDIPANDYWTNDFPIFMDVPGGTISMEAQFAGALTVTIDGTEYIKI